MAPTTERCDVAIAMLAEMCALLLPDSDWLTDLVETVETDEETD